MLCMSPTEYRSIAKRAELRPLPALRHACAAGEPLNPEVVRAWQEGVGLAIHDGYGQTETGHLTGMPIGPPVRAGSMGRPLPGFRAWIDDGELVVDPATVPTFFLDGARERPWRTGDRVREDEDGYLWFEGRTDDVIISAGYRIGPFEVESALLSHPGVAEAAAVAAPDELRGQVVRAVVVLRDGHEPGEALARELQDHVKSETAPYKYPRIIDFAAELPKTPSGKIKRGAAARSTGPWVASSTWPTGSPTRPRRTSSSTRTTPWTGTPGARRRLRAHARRSGRSCSRSATRPATGAM